MKVIGQTKDGYLLEAAPWEVSQLSDGTAAEKRSQNTWGDTVPIPIGTVFKVSPLIEHMHALKRAEKNAREGVAFLRGLADMLDKGIPDWIAEPPAEVEPAAKDEAAS